MQLDNKLHITNLNSKFLPRVFGHVRNLLDADLEAEIPTALKI